MQLHDQDLLEPDLVHITSFVHVQLHDFMDEIIPH